MLDRRTQWRASYFNTDPQTGTGLVPGRAAFQLHLTPGDLLGRAVQFVSRRGGAFDAYCSVSLADYASGADGAAPSTVQDRHALLEKRFHEALTAALPLAGVSAAAVRAVHLGEDVKYRYKFSNVPFGDVPILAERFEEVLRTWPNIDETTVQAFPNSVKQDAHATGSMSSARTRTTPRSSSADCSSRSSSSGRASPMKRNGTSGSCAAPVRCMHRCRWGTPSAARSSPAGTSGGSPGGSGFRRSGGTRPDLE